MKSYHNTNKESGAVLAASEKKAQSQEEEVINYIASLGHSVEVTAEDVWSVLFKSRNVPLTSVRRAVTNLERRGHLTKTNKMKPGSMGKMIHCWRLATPDEIIAAVFSGSNVSPSFLRYLKQD